MSKILLLRISSFERTFGFAGIIRVGVADQASLFGKRLFPRFDILFDFRGDVGNATRPKFHLARKSGVILRVSSQRCIADREPFSQTWAGMRRVGTVLAKATIRNDRIGIASSDAGRQ